MKRILKGSLLYCSILLIVGFMSACKNDDPSVLKIFVRSASNDLVDGAQVVIVGDVDSNPATLEYVDTLPTNASGFASFNMDDYFTQVGGKTATGYFDVIVKKDGKEGTAYVRCRSHITTVETVFLSN